MSAINSLESAKRTVSFSGSLVGFDVLKENFKWNTLSFLCTLDCITYNIINGYDIHLFWGELVRVCFCSVTWSFGYQCAVRIYIFASNEKLMKILYDQIKAFILKMEKDASLSFVVKKFARYIDLQCKGITILFYLVGLVTISYPGFVYLITHEAILPFGFLVPGFSDTKQPGYIINYCYQALQAFLSVSGLITAQCINIIFLVGACLIIQILIINLQSLGKEVKQNDKENDKHIEKRLIKIIEAHQEIIEIVDILESLFNLMFFVDAFAVSFQIIITLFVLSKSIWISGYFIVVMVTTMLFIDCAYGLYIEMKFDAICDAVYDLPWHLMSLKNQKTFLFILIRTQNPPLLTFGSLAYMNMAAFVQIYKSIYSYFMVLKSFEV